MSPSLAYADYLSSLLVYQTATLLGALLSSVLFGIFCAQIYQYATSPGKDSRLIQCMVAVIVAIELAHIVLLWIYIVETSRSVLARTSDVFYASPPMYAAVFLAGIVGAMVQSFYAFRIYRFSHCIWLGVFPWIGSFARVGLSVVGIVLAFVGFAGRPFFIDDWIEKYGWVFFGTFGASVALDLFNTVALCVILSRHRNVTTETSQVLGKLIVWTMETGMLTSAVAVILLAITLAGSYDVLPAFLHIYPHS
ncbi:hypothetical protein EXIGLDRAFT_763810 [Exidia glandulosa HHB12029]|uniref:DUF6534 domain-containing protein n=1 Tax=Exidia glandulosa HHB12029 TaxID=1314781 RepID=A0A166B5X5_EXIGL|nr:hypothetical protein EXIGLDRAFT_763810 [Exidia glandulosa HHB12029]